MQPSDTAYPRLKHGFNHSELERWYTPTPEELGWCSTIIKFGHTRFGFIILLKVFQRLGYFVTTTEVPDAVIDHISKTLNQTLDREQLAGYDVSRIRTNHISLIRRHLDVIAFGKDARKLMSKTLADAALTKDDLANIINIGIETLVKHRFELPPFGVLLREAKLQRVATYRTLYQNVYDRLNDADRKTLDTLFVVGDGVRTSLWNDLKNDAQKSTLDGLRERLVHHERLSSLAGNSQVLKDIPIVKRQQLALEGLSLNSAKMLEMESKKRYAVALALIQRQLARVTDDLCDIFCKQMLKVQHLAEAELEEYLAANQDKTDEILRRFAQLDTVLQSVQPIEDQIANAKQLVSARPDLCEFSRTHAEYGGKNECRFMWRYFKQRRTQLFRIQARLTFIATSQDKSFERALAFALANHHRHTDWINLASKGEATLTAEDLDWVPEKWWQLVTGEASDKVAPTRVNRRQFEICVCRQLVQELKSADICVPGSDTYSDYREQLLQPEECAAALAEYGEIVGLPVNDKEFIKHLRGNLSDTANKVDQEYPANSCFNIVDGRATLAKLIKKPVPEGFNAIHDALNLSYRRWIFQCLMRSPILCAGCSGAGISGH